MKNIFIFGLLAFTFFLSGCGKENLDRTNPLDPLYNTGTGSGGTGVIEGICYVGSSPTAGAVIYTSPASKSTTTDALGKYTLSSVPVGTYSVKAEVPWYAPYTSGSFGLTAGSYRTENINIPNANFNYHNPCLPDGFETYSTGVVPSSPWTYTSSFGTVVVDGTVAANGSKSCKVDVGGTAGNFGNLELFGIYAAKGVRVSARMQVNNLLSNVKMGVRDANSNVTEIGFDGSAAANKVKYSYPPSNNVTPSIGTTLTVNTWYVFYIEVDNEAKTVKFQIWDRYKTTSYLNTGALSFSATTGSINKFYVSNTYYSAATVVYVDDVEIIKK